MTLLIIYQSVEGQTRRIAEFVRDLGRDAGIEVAMFDAADRTGQVPFEGAERVILAAPVHERRHPQEFELLATTAGAELGERRTLMLSVSLSAAFPEGIEEAEDYLTEFEMRTGFRPDDALLVAGAVRTGRYDYFATQVVRHVVLRGRGYDPGQGEREFTDWEALRQAVWKFLETGSGSDRRRESARGG